MSVMNVDWDKLRIILLPHVLRQGSLLEALLRTAYAPLKRLYASFTEYEARESLERQYGPTVRQLRAAIATHLGISESLVLLGEVANRDLLDVRRQSDGPSTRLVLGSTPLTLWSEDQVWWNREFTVSLPARYNAPYIQREIESILDRWKMAASHYTITYYTQI